METVSSSETIRLPYGNNLSNYFYMMTVQVIPARHRNHLNGRNQLSGTNNDFCGFLYSNFLASQMLPKLSP